MFDESSIIFYRYFYNEFTDREYEEFLMKHNKKTIMDKFTKLAP